MKSMTYTMQHEIYPSQVEIAIAKLLDNKKQNITTYMVEMFIKENIYQRGNNWSSGMSATLGSLDQAEYLAPTLFPELY